MTIYLDLDAGDVSLVPGSSLPTDDIGDKGTSQRSRLGFYVLVGRQRHDQLKNWAKHGRLPGMPGYDELPARGLRRTGSQIGVARDPGEMTLCVLG